ncbi:hypothetical protein MJO28_003769, partial [Puccinia striiformis f. sp. tritici]
QTISELIQLDESGQLIQDVISQYLEDSVQSISAMRQNLYIPLILSWLSIFLHRPRQSRMLMRLCHHFPRDRDDLRRLGQEAVHLRGSATALGLLQVDHICDSIHTQCRATATNHMHRQIDYKIRLLEEANRRAQRWLSNFLNINITPT